MLPKFKDTYLYIGQVPIGISFHRFESEIDSYFRPPEDDSISVFPKLPTA
jgi:hypothetical protein